MTAESTKVRIGIDTGGTFTDFVLLDETGLHVHKLRSTPKTPPKQSWPEWKLCAPFITVLS